MDFLNINKRDVQNKMRGGVNFFLKQINVRGRYYAPKSMYESGFHSCSLRLVLVNLTGP